MTIKSALLRALAIAFSIGLLIGGATLPARADETVTDPAFDGKTHLDFTPYVWVPTFNAQFRYNLSDIRDFLPSDNRSFDTTVGPNKYLSKLNFALMFNAQLRRGKYALITDLINVNAGNQQSSVNSITGPLGIRTFNVYGSAGTTAVATIWTIAPAVTVYQKDRTNANVLIGTRLMWMKGSIDFNLQGQNGFFPLHGSAQKSQGYGDIIIGTYGSVGLGKHWAIPFYLDGGTGSPDFTLQAATGVKYGNLGLTYRYLYFSSNSTTDNLVQNLRLNGPQVGYTFRF